MMCVSFYTVAIKITCTSTAEAECAAIYECAKTIIACKHMVTELGYAQPCITVYTDNNAAEVISNEQHPSRKARCWRVRACFIQEVVAANIIRIEHMSGKQIPADCATKHAIPHLRTIARRVCAVDRIIPDANGDTITNVSGMQGKGESDEPITSPT